MANFFKKQFRKFLILALALTMTIAAFGTVACKDKGKKSSDNPSSSTTITERIDNQLLKNGDFEYGTANTKYTAFPISTSINWTKAYDSLGNNSAPSSSYSSGIIDTREYAYEYDEDGFVKLDEEGNPILAKDKNGKLIPVFSEMAKNQNFEKIYEYEKDENGNDVVKKDENGVDIFTYYNPRTPSYYGLVEYDTEDKTATSVGGKILMIHNYRTTAVGVGTAQYFTSSTSVTLNPEQNGRIELWVLTKDLKTDMENYNYGAYVKVETKIGNSTAPSTVISNINTYGQWMKVVVDLEGSIYAKTSYTIVLGLGSGVNNQTDFVEGFAFFDDVRFITDVETLNTPTQEEYNVKLYNNENKLKSDDKLVSDFNVKYPNESSIITNPATGKEYADFDSALTYSELNAKISAIKTDEKVNATEIKSEVSYKGTTVDNVYPYQSNVFNVDTDVSLTTFADKNISAENVLGNTTDNLIYFKYVNPSTVSYETDDFKVKPQENFKLTFYVKTALIRGVDGLTIELIDKGDKQIPEIYYDKVSVLSNFVTVAGSNSEKNDYTKITVVATNSYKKELDRYFSLKFTFGATTAKNDLLSFPVGEVFITNFTKMYMTKEEISDIESVENKYVTTRELQADLDNINSTESTDTYVFNYGIGSQAEIKTQPVKDFQNYDGLVGNHVRVGGDKEDYKQTSTVSGVINTKYINDYVTNNVFGEYTSAVQNWVLNELKPYGNNEHTQPIMIKNDNSSYGYIASTGTSLDSEKTYLITVDVKIIGNAKAYIYLSDANDHTDFTILSVGDVTNEYTGESILANDTKYQVVLDETTCNNQSKKGWTTVTFLIKTGADKEIDKDYRLELWNGSRDGNEPSTGIVFFDNVTFNSEAVVESTLLELKYKFGDSYKTAEDSKITFTQKPTLVKDNDHPNGVIENYEKGDVEHTSTVYMSNGIFIYSDLTSVNALLEVDKTVSEDTDDDHDHDHDHDHNETSFSPVLYATSIIVTLALLAAILAIVIKRIISAIKKRRKNSASYYDSSLRDKVTEDILARRRNQNDKEYDYDNMDNNLEEETTEEVTEETTEEVTEETTEEVTEETTEEVVEENNDASSDDKPE